MLNKLTEIAHEYFGIYIISILIILFTSDYFFNPFWFLITSIFIMAFHAYFSKKYKITLSFYIAILVIVCDFIGILNHYFQQ